MHEVVQQWHNQPGKKNEGLLKRLMLSRQETIRWIRLGFYKPRGPKNSRDDPEVRRYPTNVDVFPVVASHDDRKYVCENEKDGEMTSARLQHV